MNISWFRLGMASIFLLSVTLRFWGLSRFNTLVFDEVHFATFANNYLIHKTFFENHPPLGKYFIAVGIWLSQWLPFGHGESNTLAGSALTPFSYRWMNALMGSFIPLIVAGIAYELTKRRSYTFIAGLFAALDGLFLVESRYALINVYLVMFGLLGQWLFLLALERDSKKSEIFLSLAGVCFGASFAVKWSGLAFLLATYLLWFAAKIIDYTQIQWQKQSDPNLSKNDSLSLEPHKFRKAPIEKLAELSVMNIVLKLLVLPFIVYSIIWIPHIQLNTNMNMWEWQKYLYLSQKSVGANVHPYCSPWYSWLLMRRPVGYYFQTANIAGDGLNQVPQEIYYDVHGIGNPILWWLSTGAIAFIVILLLQKLVILNSHLISPFQKILLVRNQKFWILLYLSVNFIANLLPWLSITRCTFLYHYMGASVFSVLALGWFIDRYLRYRRLIYQLFAFFTIAFIIIAFCYWLPIYLGLPLSPIEFQSRMLLRSWY
ncbi:phospholipid carrier-dependent glycosyltransferase [Nostoc sp. NIES-2111]